MCVDNYQEGSMITATSFRSSTPHRLVAAGLCGALLLLGACGSAKAEPSAKASATPTAAPARAAQTRTAAPSKRTQKKESHTKLVFSGALNGQGTEDGACGVVFTSNYKAVFSGIEADGYRLFQIYVKRYEGPGTFDDSRLELNFTDGMGNSWVTGGKHKGSVTINPDGRSGTVRGTLFNKDTNSTVEVDGAFGCDA
jgi:hypothetical protein